MACLIKRIGIILYEIADERFRHRAVHSVHRHLIAIIGRPPERQFRHIPGSDDETVLLVRDVHQDLRPLPRLSILICDIMHINIMADILKMLPYRLLNRNLPESRAKNPSQVHRIFIRPVRRPKAGHRHADDPLPIKSQLVECAYRHEKSKCRIQSSRKPDDRTRTSCMAQPLHQSCCLYIQDLIAPLLPVVFRRRHKRRLFKRACQLRAHHISKRKYMLFVSKLLWRLINKKRSHTPSLRGQFPQIQFRYLVLLRKRAALSKHGPVFRNDIVRGVYEVSRRLAPSGIGIQVTGDGPRALSLHEFPPVSCLPRRLITGRRIDDNSRSRHCVVRTRRQRHPEIFADLDRHGQRRNLLAHKQLPRPKTDFPVLKRQLMACIFFRSRGEMPSLIKLGIHRDMALWH